MNRTRPTTAVHPGAGVPCWRSGGLGSGRHSTNAEKLTLTFVVYFLGSVCNKGYSAWSEHSAYGKRTVLEADGSTEKAKSSYGQTRGFTGYSLDEETGLYYARSRMYSAGLGRFVGRDFNGGIGDPRYRVAFTEDDYPPRIDKHWYSSRPLAEDGYIDGYSLYMAYFVPLGVDPSGHADLGETNLAATLKTACTKDCEGCCIQKCKDEADAIAAAIWSADNFLLNQAAGAGWTPGGWTGNAWAAAGSLFGAHLAFGCKEYSATEDDALKQIEPLACWYHDYITVHNLIGMVKHRFIRITNICTGKNFDSKSWDNAYPTFEPSDVGE
jgi:RHS repeat-associated protein